MARFGGRRVGVIFKWAFFLAFILAISNGEALSSDESKDAEKQVILYAGAGLIKPVEALRKAFETAEAIPIHVHYGNSGELFGMMAMGTPCDVFIPGAEKYMQDALKNGWIDASSIRNLVLHIPVIAVSFDNPKQIQGLNDFSRPDVAVALGDFRGPAIGKVAKTIFSRMGIWEDVRDHVRVFTPTVNQLLIYISMNQADAAIIWKDLAIWPENKKTIRLIPIPEEQNIVKTIPCAMTSHGMKHPMVRKFHAFISSEAGLAIWEDWGFEQCGK